LVDFDLKVFRLHNLHIFIAFQQCRRTHNKKQSQKFWLECRLGSVPVAAHALAPAPISTPVSAPVPGYSTGYESLASCGVNCSIMGHATHLQIMEWKVSL